MTATVHVLNAFMDPFGGSEAEALEIFRWISGHRRAHLWATSARASPLLLATHPIRKARLLTAAFPRSGIFVFVGAHWLRRPWTLLAKPDRLIYVFNTFHPKVLDIAMQPSPRPGWPTAEVVMISEFQRRRLGVSGGVIHPSPIDINRFKPASRPASARFTVGRMSRDTPIKFDPSDFPVFRRLAERGIRVRLMGATSVHDPLLLHPLIERMPEGHEAAEAFLNSLDVFLYRSGTHVETFGRVVLEAMACGLPVVCGKEGGYAEHIRSGVDGILFGHADEAERAVLDLLANEQLRVDMGQSARRKAEELYSSAAVAERMSFYCNETQQSLPLKRLPN